MNIEEKKMNLWTILLIGNYCTAFQCCCQFHLLSLHKNYMHRLFIKQSNVLVCSRVELSAQGSDHLVITTLCAALLPHYFFPFSFILGFCWTWLGATLKVKQGRSAEGHCLCFINIKKWLWQTLHGFHVAVKLLLLLRFVLPGIFPRTFIIAYIFWQNDVSKSIILVSFCCQLWLGFKNMSVGSYCHHFNYAFITSAVKLVSVLVRLGGKGILSAGQGFEAIAAIKLTVIFFHLGFCFDVQFWVPVNSRKGIGRAKW